MKIVDRKNATDSIAKLIMSKARYQKVVFCLDANSDMCLVDKICELVGRNAIIIKYYYNKKNVIDFFNIINNGVRVVVYDISTEGFYATQNNNTFLLNVFIAQSDFVLPYVTNVDSVYGENMLICNMNSRDYYSIACMYEFALNDIWSKLLQGVQVNTDMFKHVDSLMSCDNFHAELIDIVKHLQQGFTNSYRRVKENDMCMYVYLKISCILDMLQRLNFGNERYIDFYKSMQTSKDVDKAYNLILKCDTIERLRFYCSKLMKVVTAICNRIKIIIKKYLNSKNIKHEKLIKIIKKEAICANVDKLIYISHIFNCV